MVIGRSMDKGMNKREDVSCESRFTDVFVNRDGRDRANRG